MNKLFGILTVLLICTFVAAEEDYIIRCFKTTNVTPPIELQFVLTSNPDEGYVIYKNENKPIPVIKLKEKELKEGPKGRPSEFEISWKELSSNDMGGTYIMVSQGAIISELRYIRKKDAKLFKFEEQEMLETPTPWATLPQKNEGKSGS